MKSEIALYYPYIHFRDEEWLKSAVLYWPRIARMVPVRSGPRDSPLVQALCDDGVIVNVHAGGVTAEVSREFGRFVSKYRGSLANSYSLDEEVIVSATTVGSHGYYGQREAIFQTQNINSAAPFNRKPNELDYVWIDEDVMEESLVSLLTGLHLVERRLTKDGMPWLAMNRHLASVYKCALADRVARLNSMQVVTDQPREHAVLNGWTVETIAQALLRDDPPESGEFSNVAEVFALLAIRTVVPDLSKASIQQILEVRKHLQPEFFAFRNYLTSLSDKLIDIANIPDTSVRIARLEILADQEIRPKVNALEKQIAKARMEPLSAVLSLKSLTPPAIVAAAGLQAGLSPLTTASAAIAACFISSLRASRAKIDFESSSSPIAYLLGLRRQLTPERSVRIAHAVSKRQAITQA